jgi:hypothetical protein
MRDLPDNHDRECERELTSHGYTPCRCDERVVVSAASKTVHVRRMNRSYQAKHRKSKRSYLSDYEDAVIVLAWERGDLSEGQASKALGLDRLSARIRRDDLVSAGLAMAATLLDKRRDVDGGQVKPSRRDIVDAHAATVAMFGSTAARQAADYMAEWLLSSVRNGVALIASERDRQVRSEGWTPEHDDEHENGELISAAVWYADNGCEFDLGLRLPPWPFEPEAWKASDDRVGQLVKAGALIAAEIDRLQRRDGPRDVDGGHLKPSTSAEPSNTKAFSESRETALREALQRVTLDPDDFIGTVWQRAEGGAVFLSQHTGRAITLDDYKAARAALSLPAAPREGE